MWHRETTTLHAPFPFAAGAGLLCLWGQLPAQASSSSVNHIGEGTDMIQAQASLASSPAGPFSPGKMTFHILIL